MNENVLKLLKSSMWNLVTSANGEPNVVLYAFQDVTEGGKRVVGNVFLETTLKELITDEIINRKQVDEIPPHVEYCLTELKIGRFRLFRPMSDLFNCTAFRVYFSEPATILLSDAMNLSRQQTY